MDSQGRRFVLYVDDEPRNLLVFDQSFSRKFPVKMASSAQEALTILEHGDIDVVVTDQRMPGMSGNDLLRIVKERHPDIIRVIITAYSDLDPILRAVNDGLVARYVVKPWEREEVERILTWALEVARLGRENAAVQERLLKTERLATLGSVHQALLHDVSSPATYMSSVAEHLAELGASTPALLTLLERHGDELAVVDRDNLGALARELSETVDHLRAGCETVAGMVRGVQGLLRQSQSPVVRAANPDAAIRFALAVCRKSPWGQGVEFESRGHETLPGVRIGQAELTQSLINLVSNAAQACHRQAIVKGRVQVAGEDLGERVRIEISDDGVGMSPMTLSRLGRIFFTTREGGTGLGLHNCRRLIEGAGGQLQIASEEGKGSTVTVMLPVADRGQRQP